MSSKPGQAQIYFYRSERWPLPLLYLQDRQLVGSLKRAIRMAEDAAGQLRRAAWFLASGFLSSDGGSESGRVPDRKDVERLQSGWRIEERFWAELETHFRVAMEALVTDRERALSQWRDTLQRTAWSAYDSVEQNLGATPKALKASVRARDHLAAGLAMALPAGGGLP
ncbi:MAG: type I-E CRISPR-associated protein Cse1/CasA, partial [Chloroflexi bacterium]|nr:type I-E CRISPR-associated protein Cse1/CasA [Chloroflexota bacterium]